MLTEARCTLEVCPGYKYDLSEADKEVIDQAMPAMIAEALPDGYASDELIAKHIGHIIGGTARGLPRAGDELGIGALLAAGAGS